MIGGEADDNDRVNPMVPMNALFKVFWKTGSPGCGTASGLNALPGAG
jgi:hypothetical protein